MTNPPANIKNGQKVPILVYHHIYAESSPELETIDSGMGAGVLGEAAFRRQMEHIADENWTVVSTSRVIDWDHRRHVCSREGCGAPLRQWVARYSDDGVSRSCGTLVLRPTCFPITDGLEAATNSESIEVRTLTEGVVEKPFMTWDQVRELVDAGWEIGAHTATHCKVAETHAQEGDDGVIREAEISNDLFLQRLDFAPDHFAYPSGSRNDSTDAVLSRYYRSLRLWHFDWPIRWSLTSDDTSPQAIECQNIDVRVTFEDFRRIFVEAA